LLLGFPVALTLGGTALSFAALGILLGHFDPSYLTALTGRIFGTMGNETLVAVPLFILMGVVLERAKIAEDLLANLAGMFGARPGGLGLAVILVGALLAASTGIVGATVVTMGVLALPTMLRAGYQPQLAAGTICATGTLGQIIPPSIALVLLGDTMSSAYQQAQLKMNIVNTQTVSVGDLFVGAIVPGIVLVFFYLAYVLIRAAMQPSIAPPAEVDEADIRSVVTAVLPPLGLIGLVLGSILVGAATPTEAAGVGAVGGVVARSEPRRIDASGVTRHLTVHPLYHEHGFFNSHWCRVIFVGFSRIWWRYNDRIVFCSVRRRASHSVTHCHAGHVSAGLYSRLY